MSKKDGLIAILTGTLFTLMMSFSAMVLADEDDHDDDHDGKMYEVTITNITKGTLFTPVAVFTHKHNHHPIFKLGEPAGDELAAVAEAGDTGPLLEKLSDMGMVFDSASTGLMHPGDSATVKVKFTGKYRFISLAAMLLPTNDGFIAINGMPGPKDKKHPQIVMIPGYDAGSETNDELCAHIPGPCMGEALSPMDDGEGYVYIHAGIQGGGDLMPKDHDWRNPVAKVSIKRVRH